MASRYWVGGSGTWDNSDPSHWAAQSGGAGGQGVPSSTDDVFFDSNSSLSGQTIVVTSPSCHNLISSVGSAYTMDMSTGFVSVYGSLTLESYLLGIGNATEFDMHSTSVETITGNGCTSIGFLSFYGIGGYWSLQDDLLVTASLYIENGTLDGNGHNPTFNEVEADAYQISPGVFATPTLKLGSGVWRITGARDSWDLFEFDGQVVTIVPGTSTIQMDASNEDGAVTSVNFGSTLGTGYQAGDVVTLVGGNNNATATIVFVGGGGVPTGLGFSYGSQHGTGYADTTNIPTTGGHGSGLTLNITVVGETSFGGASKTYNNLFFTGSASGTRICKIGGSNTFNDVHIDTPGRQVQFQTGTTTTLNSFRCTGASGNIITLTSDSTGTHSLVKATPGVISCDYLNIQHSVATPSNTWYAGPHSTNNQAVSTAGSGWIFTNPPQLPFLAILERMRRTP